MVYCGVLLCTAVYCGLLLCGVRLLLSVFTVEPAHHQPTLVTQAMTYLLSSLITHLAQKSGRATLTTAIPLPLLGHVPVATLASAAVSLAVAVAWFVGQDAVWGWLPQNAMGVCLMLTVLRLVRLPDLRVGAMLLGLAFCYDVFWCGCTC